MRASWSLKRTFSIFLGAGTVCAILFIASLYAVRTTQVTLDQANDSRYRSFLLADELRQSSDDLTRLARTYVVTGDAAYERQYMDILDIRNGKKARPQNYERIYWDFVAAGDAKPQPDGQTVALADLMKEAGFSVQEFAKLKEAQDNSDALVKTEVIAMNAVKGLFDDGTGKFVKRDAPDMELARKLVHSPDYHRYKAQIMKPVNEFLVLLEQRTSQAVQDASAANQRAFLVAMVLLLAGLGSGGVAMLLLYRRLSRQLGAEPAVAQAIANRIAAGDLAADVTLRQGDDSSLMFAMAGMRDSLAGIVSQVRAGTDAMAATSSQLSAGNQELSDRTTEQAGSLQTTASSMEELTATVRHNADNARQANVLALSASELASKGGAVVSDVVTTMESINTSARKIVDIISVIDGIAFQTNILALNAAVEAARAGEQGRGFAVVASEVRNLAQRSAAAAKEIKELITDSVDKVDSGSRLVNQAGGTMHEIVESVRRVADMIGDITASSQEQSAGIEQVNTAVAQMDEATHKNAALVEQAAAASDDLRDQAEQLTGMVSVFKLGAGMQTAAATPRPRAAAPVTRLVAKPAVRPPRPPAKAARAAPRLQANGAGNTEWEEF